MSRNQDVIRDTQIGTTVAGRATIHFNAQENLEASTGIEPVYTDLQSAASPLRQLAADGVSVD